MIWDSGFHMIKKIKYGAYDISSNEFTGIIITQSIIAPPKSDSTQWPLQ